MNRYPGYKKKCNRCGLCCLSIPCSISEQYGLWVNGKCEALKKLSSGKYRCDVITNAKRLKVGLEKYTKKDRMDVIGVIGICDHRAAWSFDEADKLINEKNLLDEINGNEIDTYPRACVVHLGSDKYFYLKHQKKQKPVIEKIVWFSGSNE